MFDDISPLGLLSLAATLAIPAVGILFLAGQLYWLWLAVELGSFGMLLLGLFPPTVLFTAPAGAYALIAGTPQWIYSIFN